MLEWSLFQELRSTWTPDYYLHCAERKILEDGGSALPRGAKKNYTPELKLIHLSDQKLTTLAIIYGALARRHAFRVPPLRLRH